MFKNQTVINPPLYVTLKFLLEVPQFLDIHIVSAIHTNSHIGVYASNVVVAGTEVVKIYVKVKFTLLFLKGPSLYLKMDLQKRRLVH